VKITTEDADRIKAASLSNIIKKVKEGGTLTATERKAVDQSTKEAEESARVKLVQGAAILRGITEVIKSSNLKQSEKDGIFQKLSTISV
tara:strand:+ start:1373 stop:1639 length:267 start_codon:yes stop_codon:yes gene_type:complete